MKIKQSINYFHSSSKAKIIINEREIDHVLQSIYTTIISNIQKSLGKDSGWIIDSVNDHTISISKYSAGSRYIKLAKELDYPKKVLINIQNINDTECFKCSIVSCVNPATQQELQKLTKNMLKSLIVNP